LKLFKIFFKYAEVGHALIAADDEETAGLGFYEMFGEQIDELEITEIETVEEEFTGQMAPTTETVN